MSQALVVVRTKPDLLDDGDPTDGVFTPPEDQLWKPAADSVGFYISVDFGAIGATGRLRIYVRDVGEPAAMPNIVTWKFAPLADRVIAHGEIYVETDCGFFECWFRLTGISPAAMAPIVVKAAEIDQ
jgi:hypothetical protein